MGPQVAELEQNASRHFAGVEALHRLRQRYGCAADRAAGVECRVRATPSFVPAFTFAATAEVVALVGASPVFVDVLPDTLQHGSRQP